MVTEEEAVEIATRLVQEKIKEPWKFNSVHLMDPLELTPIFHTEVRIYR